MPGDVNIGELLISQNLITRGQYEECLQIQAQEPQKTLTDVVLERGLCTREALAQAVARFNQYAFEHPDPEESVELYENVTERLHRNTAGLLVVASMLRAKRGPGGQ